MSQPDASAWSNNRKLPQPGPEDAAARVNTANLREQIEDLLDTATHGGRIVKLSESAVEIGQLSTEVNLQEHSDTASDNRDADAEPQLIEITDEQVEALSAAHDALAEALATLDETG